MDYLNDWHDYLRAGLLLILIYSLVVLIDRFARLRALWNDKTKDYWYAMLMWCIAGVVLLIQGMVLDRGVTPGLILLTASTLVTGRGVHRKGDWGSGA